MVKMTCYSDVPGWGDFPIVYRDLVASLPANASILELGVGFGRGTWTMLDAMTDTMSLYIIDSFNAVDTVDLWENYFETGSPVTLSRENILEYGNMTKIYNHYEIFLHNICQHTRYSQIQAIHAISSDEYIASNFKNDFDLVFLDGEHSYEAVKQELEYFKNSGIISGHDYNIETWPGVIQAVTEFLDSNPDRYLKVYEENEVFVICRR